jgi:hypothetical protein
MTARDSIIAIGLTVAAVAVSLIGPAPAEAELRSLSPAQQAAYEALSPFEFKDVLIATATESCRRAIDGGRPCRIIDAFYEAWRTGAGAQ